MKIFKYCFIFIVAFSSCRSDLPKKKYQNCTKEELAMSSHIVPYFDSFIDDCKRRNIKYDHAYCLQWMRFGHLHGMQGETDIDCGTIEINEYLEEDSIGMRFVIYHELGHWFGLEHSDGIMQESYNARDTEWVKENWDTLLDDYFTKLKQ